MWPEYSCHCDTDKAVYLEYLRTCRDVGSTQGVVGPRGNARGVGRLGRGRYRCVESGFGQGYSFRDGSPGLACGDNLAVVQGLGACAYSRTGVESSEPEEVVAQSTSEDRVGGGVDGDIVDGLHDRSVCGDVSPSGGGAGTARGVPGSGLSVVEEVKVSAKTLFNRARRQQRKVRKQRKQGKLPGDSETRSVVDAPVDAGLKSVDSVPEWRQKPGDRGRKDAGIRSSFTGFFSSCSEDVQKALKESRAKLLIAQNERKLLELEEKKEDAVARCLRRVVAAVELEKQAKQLKKTSAVGGWAETVASSFVESVVRSAPSSVPSLDTVGTTQPADSRAIELSEREMEYRKELRELERYWDMQVIAPEAEMTASFNALKRKFPDVVECVEDIKTEILDEVVRYVTAVEMPRESRTTLMIMLTGLTGQLVSNQY